MTNQNEILNNEEVEFLLESSVGGAQRDGAAAAGAQAATMRGDLEKMPLTDIFQTIGHAKMEGLLRVCNPVEQRLVHFRDGIVKIVVPPRSATRRLGQRLVQAGVLDQDQLRLALLEQRKEHKPLGELLVGSGYVTPEQIEDIITLQVTEELFGLFTWEHGEFEFFKGPVEDPAVLERLDGCPEFDVDSLLLEVARRSDEWGSILSALRSLDEVPVPAAEAGQVEGLDELHRTVLLAIDGRHTYRELGDLTVLSVFDCARASRDLMQQRLIGVASDEHLLEVARTHLEQGHGKMAVMLAQTLCDRGEARSVALVRDIAAIMRQANESRLAGEVLLEAAQLQGEPKVALELASEALAMNPRDLVAQGFLRTTMLAHKPPDAPEVEAVTLALLDGLLQENQLDRLFELVEETRQLDCCTPAVQVRYARALAKRKDKDAAITVLTQIAADVASKGDTARQIELLEMAYRMDRERKDIGKQLKALRFTPKKRAIRYATLGVVALLLVGLGAVWLNERLHADRALAAGTEITALLQAGDLPGAQSALARWEEVLGDCAESQDLRAQVGFAQTAQAQRKQKAVMKAAAERLQQAADCVANGQLRQAFETYRELRSTPALEKSVDESAVARVDALLHDLDDAQKHLPGLLPDPPNDLTEQQVIVETLTMLRRRVSARLRTAAHEIGHQSEGAGLPAEIPAEKRKALMQAAKTCVELLDRGAELTRLYEAAAARNDQQRQLDPLFKQALDSERVLDFAQALAAYRKLAAADAGSATLRQHFTQKVQQLEGIVDACTAIAKATTAGDYVAANRAYQALCQKNPQIPFQHVVHLPVLVSTSMPGARVRWNGADAGQTPLLGSFLPAMPTRLEFELAQFVPTKVDLPPDNGGRFDVLLTLRADRTLELPANTDQQVAIGRDGRAFAVDRAAAVLAIDTTQGHIAWRVPTNDTAGYLSPPLIYRDTIVVGSLDGPLRAFNQATGKIAWQRDDVATEWMPALVDGRIAVATSKAVIALFDPQSGEPLGTVPLPAPPRGEPLGASGLLLVPLADSTTLCVDLKEQRVVWHSAAGQLGQTQRLTPAGLLALRDDGELELVAAETGKSRWQRQLPGTATGRMSTSGSHVVITLDDRVVMLQLADGAERWSAPRPDGGWQDAARFVGDLIAAPTRSGAVLVFGSDSPAPRYRIAAERMPSVSSESRELAIVTGGRTLAIFRKLP